MKNNSHDKIPVFRLNDPKVGKKIEAWMSTGSEVDYDDESISENSSWSVEAEQVADNGNKILSQVPVSRLDLNLKNSCENDIGFIDSFNEAISPLRALDDLLCVGKFCETEPVVEACARIVAASIRDLDYVLERWRAL